MALIPEHLIDRIRESTDIVEVISRYVSLKKSGRNYKALCPFHTEKTPSFTVSSEKQIFHCFGCGAGGNVFNFLMRYEKISFLEAVEKLATEQGIELPKKREAERVSDEYDRLYRANQFAADFYHRTLQKQFDRLKGYLNRRNLTEETLKFFKIGLAPDAWDQLLQEVQKNKLGPDAFLKTGLLMTSEKDPNRKYDRFRNRLMFPIHNLSGRVVAFGGRDLSDDPHTPKYINSPESPVYQKSQILYGLYYSRDWIRQEGFAIFVEGYMDYLQLFQHGIKNVVATSGTALTEQHAALIRRYTSDVILCYDADTAGVNAAIRGGQILFQDNLNVRVVLLPEGEDPDSFVKNQGTSAFYALLDKAEDYFEFRMNRLQNSLKEGDVAGHSQAVNELLDSLAPHSDPIKQNFYMNRLAERFGLQEATLLAEIRKRRKILRRREERTLTRQKPEPVTRAGTALIGAWRAEKDILIILLNYFEEVKHLIFKHLEPQDFLNEPFRKMFVRIRENQDRSGDELIHFILSEIEDETVINLLTADLFKEILKPARYLKDCMEQVKIAFHQHQLEANRQKLKQLSPQDPEFNRLMTEINDSLTQIRQIRTLFKDL